MTDEKLNGIIKALKLCTGSETACKDCPYRASVSPSFFVRCEDTLHEASLEAIEALKAENAVLRERLDKAIEPPCERDDIFYRFFQYPAEMVEDIACGFRKEKDGELYVCSANSESWYNVKECEFSREADEARLKELQGGKQ